MIKRIIGIVIIGALILALTGCGQGTKKKDESVSKGKEQTVEIPQDSNVSAEKSTEDKAPKPDNNSSSELDLTNLTGNTLYSEVFNIICTPNDYKGKTIKMRGTFDVYTDELTGKTYYACIISDAPGCCKQGLEFELENNEGNLPKPGDEILSLIHI